MSLESAQRWVERARAEREATDLDPSIACPTCGRESCAEPLHVVRTRFRSAADMMAEGSPAIVIDGMAWQGCVTVKVAESGAGKTFVALDAGAALAEPEWHGRPVTAGSVAYVVFEADAIGLRLRALEQAGRPIGHLYVLRASEPLSPAVSREGIETPSPGELALSHDLAQLAAQLERCELPPVRLVVIDTARASMTGSEDQSDNVAAYLRAIRRVGAIVPSAAQLVIHHAGWQDGDSGRRRERGSSAWRGNADATVYLETVGEPDSETGDVELRLTTHKARDAQRMPPLSLIRRRVTLSGVVDSLGRPATSCVIVSDPRTSVERTAERDAELAAEQRVLDLQVLRIMRDRPQVATSQDGLRAALGVRKDVVAKALKRLIERGWAHPGRRGQPYVITTEGSDLLLQEGS
jgi:hypothetical protein